MPVYWKIAELPRNLFAWLIVLTRIILSFQNRSNFENPSHFNFDVLYRQFLLEAAFVKYTPSLIMGLLLKFIPLWNTLISVQMTSFWLIIAFSIVLIFLRMLFKNISRMRNFLEAREIFLEIFLRNFLRNFLWANPICESECFGRQ